MGVVRKTSGPVVLNSFMCAKASLKAKSSLCLGCWKLFLSFQPVIYENIFEEIGELKYCILTDAHYVQICFTNKTGCSGELNGLNTAWICKFTLCLSSDHPPPAFSLGRVLLSQLYLGPFPCGPRQQLSLSYSHHNASHLTHTQKRVFCQCHFCPTATLFFSLQAKAVRTLPVEGVAWSRHLGEEWLLYRPPMLQSCDCSWR